VRTLWRDYFFETDAIIFMVDSADLERMEEAKQVGWLVGWRHAFEWSGVARCIESMVGSMDRVDTRSCMGCWKTTASKPRPS